MSFITFLFVGLLAISVCMGQSSTSGIRDTTLAPAVNKNGIINFGDFGADGIGPINGKFPIYTGTNTDSNGLITQKFEFVNPTNRDAGISVPLTEYNRLLVVRNSFSAEIFKKLPSVLIYPGLNMTPKERNSLTPEKMEKRLDASYQELYKKIKSTTTDSSSQEKALETLTSMYDAIKEVIKDDSSALLRIGIRYSPDGWFNVFGAELNKKTNKYEMKLIDADISGFTLKWELGQITVDATGEEIGFKPYPDENHMGKQQIFSGYSKLAGQRIKVFTDVRSAEALILWKGIMPMIGVGGLVNSGLKGTIGFGDSILSFMDFDDKGKFSFIPVMQTNNFNFAGLKKAKSIKIKPGQ